MSATVADVLASFEADGTAPHWRAVWEGLTDEQRERLTAEWKGGDRFAGLILAVVDPK